AVDECGLGAFTAALLVDAGLDELVVKIVALTGTLADTREHGVTAVRLGDVVDQLLDENRLAHAGAAEQADLAALGVRSQEVENLDARDENFGFRRLLDIFRCGLVNTAHLRRSDRAGFINRLTNHVDDAAEHFRAHRNADRRSRIPYRLTADQTIGRVHRDAADGVFAQVLCNLKKQTRALIIRLKRVQDRGQMVPELDVHHRADNLTDGSNRTIGRDHLGYLGGATAGRLGGRLGRCRSGCRCFSHSLYLFDPLERFRARNDFDQFL